MTTAEWLKQHAIEIIILALLAFAIFFVLISPNSNSDSPDFVAETRVAETETEGALETRVVSLRTQRAIEAGTETQSVLETDARAVQTLSMLETSQSIAQTQSRLETSRAIISTQDAFETEISNIKTQSAVGTNFVRNQTQSAVETSRAIVETQSAVETGTAIAQTQPALPTIPTVPSETPVPTNIVLPTDTDTPVLTDTVIPTDTDTPVLTNTDTPTPAITDTPDVFADLFIQDDQIAFVFTFLISKEQYLDCHYAYRERVTEFDCSRPSEDFDNILDASLPLGNISKRLAISYCNYIGGYLPTRNEASQIMSHSDRDNGTVESEWLSDLSFDRYDLHIAIFNRTRVQVAVNEGFIDPSIGFRCVRQSSN